MKTHLTLQVSHRSRAKRFQVLAETPAGQKYKVQLNRLFNEGEYIYLHPSDFKDVENCKKSVRCLLTSLFIEYFHK